jgi:ABC-type transport system involved in multi-copper enzyme maturation permease subunit
MSAITASPSDTASTGVTMPRVLRSEWIKLRTLRSTVLTLLIAIVLMDGLGLLFAWGFERHWAEESGAERAGFDPTLLSQRGMFLGQLAIGVLGVLIVTGEYSTGMIRATFAAVPKRLPVLAAKTIVYGAVAFVVSSIAAFGAFFGGQRILAVQHISTGIGDPHVARAVVGTALYLTGIGVLGIALGSLLRNAAGAIATLFGLVLVLPILGQVLPLSWATKVNPYLPSNAGQAIMNVVPDSSMMAPWTGFLLFAGYVAAALAAAAVVLRSRDA